MDAKILVPLLSFYGVFLISCGIVAVIFIVLKAKTALASGGLSGGILILLAYLVSVPVTGAASVAIVVSLTLFIVFSWRSAKTLFTIFDLIRNSASAEDLKSKGIAFLIISLMAVVSIIMFGMQIVVCGCF